MFYHCHEGVVAQDIGKGTRMKERRCVGRFGFGFLSTQ